mmetsp:Transcript_55124/g.118329  ORF Transcript_55124/g.118329 Transcript_55124/m.118329 type:complete len:235 (-) Transcript_55124:1027-1731(-)
MRILVLGQRGQGPLTLGLTSHDRCCAGLLHRVQLLGDGLHIARELQNLCIHGVDAVLEFLHIRFLVALGPVRLRQLGVAPRRMRGIPGLLLHQLLEHATHHHLHLGEGVRAGPSKPCGHSCVRLRPEGQKCQSRSCGAVHDADSPAAIDLPDLEEAFRRADGTIHQDPVCLVAGEDGGGLTYRHHFVGALRQSFLVALGLLRKDLFRLAELLLCHLVKRRLLEEARLELARALL